MLCIVCTQLLCPVCAAHCSSLVSREVEHGLLQECKLAGRWYQLHAGLEQLLVCLLQACTIVHGSWVGAGG
jgi:hypothetical protein